MENKKITASLINIFNDAVLEALCFNERSDFSCVETSIEEDTLKIYLDGKVVSINIKIESKINPKLIPVLQDYIAANSKMGENFYPELDEIERRKKWYECLLITHIKNIVSNSYTDVQSSLSAVFNAGGFENPIYFPIALLLDYGWIEPRLNHENKPICWQLSNKGLIDLKNENAIKSLAASIIKNINLAGMSFMTNKLTELIKQEKKLINKLFCAYGQIPEANDELNNMQRKIIAAVYEAYSKAYIGKINYYGKEREKLTADKVFAEYTGQTIYNFDADFVVPAADTELAEIIVLWNTQPTAVSGNLITKISDRIEEIGGFNLLWS